MTAVFVEIGMPARQNAEIEFVDDLDEVLESEKCSCNAGDDNPY